MPTKIVIIFNNKINIHSILFKMSRFDHYSCKYEINMHKHVDKQAIFQCLQNIDIITCHFL